MSKETAAPTALTRRRRRPGNWFLKALVVTTAFACAVFFTWEYLAAAVSRVQFLSWQEVSQTTPLEGIVIKEEKVIRSPASGKIHFTAADGKRLETGAEAAQVTASEEESGGETFHVFTPSAGIFCSHLDGLENILSPGNLDVLDFPKIEKIGDKPVPEGGKVEKGQPIFKIVDNLSTMYIHTRIPKSGFPADLADRPGWRQATWENLPLAIRPNKLRDQGDSWEGFFTLPNYPENLIHYRKINLKVTTSRLAGFLVPRRAIVTRDGEPGIYLAVKKKARWVPVKIEGELAGKVAVSGRGLDENTSYVSNPILAREGWPVE